ncbi:MAG: DNA-binding protein [Ruminococcus sp.]|nr:DNA-binding protein [Candidatus Apopatosoma intestinale]
MFEKDLQLNVLFDTYGDLLPEAQREVFEFYYCDDFSLAEIAESTGITRQGVRDRIAKAKRALLHYEEILGFVAKMTVLDEQRREAVKALTALQNEIPSAGEQAEKIRAILADMKC